VPCSSPSAGWTGVAATRSVRQDRRRDTVPSAIELTPELEGHFLRAGLAARSSVCPRRRAVWCSRRTPAASRSRSSRASVSAARRLAIRLASATARLAGGVSAPPPDDAAASDESSRRNEALASVRGAFALEENARQVVTMLPRTSRRTHLLLPGDRMLQRSFAPRVSATGRRNGASRARTESFDGEVAAARDRADPRRDRSAHTRGHGLTSAAGGRRRLDDEERGAQRTCDHQWLGSLSPGRELLDAFKGGVPTRRRFVELGSKTLRRTRFVLAGENRQRPGGKLGCDRRPPSGDHRARQRARPSTNYQTFHLARRHWREANLRDGPRVDDTVRPQLLARQSARAAAVGVRLRRGRPALRLARRTVPVSSARKPCRKAVEPPARAVPTCSRRRLADLASLAVTRTVLLSPAAEVSRSSRSGRGRHERAPPRITFAPFRYATARHRHVRGEIRLREAHTHAHQLTVFFHCGTGIADDSLSANGPRPGSGPPAPGPSHRRNAMVVSIIRDPPFRFFDREHGHLSAAPRGLRARSLAWPRTAGRRRNTFMGRGPESRPASSRIGQESRNQPAEQLLHEGSIDA